MWSIDYCTAAGVDFNREMADAWYASGKPCYVRYLKVKPVSLYARFVCPYGSTPRQSQFVSRP